MPSSSESSGAIDFVTALGRVLRDGALRDAFAADPALFMRKIGLRENDHGMFSQLAPADLEFQARVLLRKRFDLVRAALRRTCRVLGDAAWPEFQRYGRSSGPAGKDPVAADAWGFCQHLREVRPESLCPLELNRCRFTQDDGRRFAFHFVMAMPMGETRRPALQVLMSRQSGHWHEWLIYFGG